MVGTVKWFSNKKGYGFITAEDGNEYFVHFSALQVDGFKTVAKDAKVTFDLTTSEDGKTLATNVCIA